MICFRVLSGNKIDGQIQLLLKQVTKMNCSNTVTSKRGWTVEQDTIILQMMSKIGQERFKWIQVSKVIQQKTGRYRTGKQCRQRWQHQLNPAICRNEWNQAEQETLFETQTKVGNKWAQIAAFLPGRTDNAVKNFFYSSVRRILTKLNIYLSRHKNRKQFKIIRQFEADYLSKLMAVVDGHYDKRMRLSTPGTEELAKNVLGAITKLVCQENLIDIEVENEDIDSLIVMMQDFRKNCKKRKHVMIPEEGQRYAQSESIGEESSDSKNASSESSCGSERRGKSQPRQRCFSIDKMVAEPMELQCENQEGIRIELTTKNSTQSEDITYPEPPKLQTFDSFFENQPRLFKKASELNNEPKRDFLDLFGEELSFNKNKMEEEIFNWNQPDFDIFSMPFGQREDILSESLFFGSNQGVTNYKMLEASIALDELLLKSRQISRLG